MRNVFKGDHPWEIAVFRALQLGDMLVTLPALRALRSGFPQANITLIGLPWAAEFQQRFERYLDDFIPFPGYPGLPEQEPDLFALPGFLKNVQSRRFDLALQMQGDGSIVNLLVESFGARRTAGFFKPGGYQPGGGLFFPYPEGIRESRRMLGLVEQLGVPGQGLALEFPITAEEEDELDRLRRQLALVDKDYVCIHPGARSSNRRWPAERFAELAANLMEQGMPLVFTGSSAETGLVESIISRLPAPAVNLCGRTGLGVLAALIRSSTLVVCNDTGVSHVADGVGARSVVLFSGSDPWRWAPLDNELHRVVYPALEVPAGEVFSIVMEQLERLTAPNS